MEHAEVRIRSAETSDSHVTGTRNAAMRSDDISLQRFIFPANRLMVRDTFGVQKKELPELL